MKDERVVVSLNSFPFSFKKKYPKFALNCRKSWFDSGSNAPCSYPTTMSVTCRTSSRSPTSVERSTRVWGTVPKSNSLLFLLASIQFYSNIANYNFNEIEEAGNRNSRFPISIIKSVNRKEEGWKPKMCYVGKATKIFIFIVTILVVTGLVLGLDFLRKSRSSTPPQPQFTNPYTSPTGLNSVPPNPVPPNPVSPPALYPNPPLDLTPNPPSRPNPVLPPPPFTAVPPTIPPPLPNVGSGTQGPIQGWTAFPLFICYFFFIYKHRKYLYGFKNKQKGTNFCFTWFISVGARYLILGARQIKVC